jgi:hypothetical protein
MVKVLARLQSVIVQRDAPRIGGRIKPGTD